MFEIDLTKYLKRGYKFDKVNDIKINGKNYIFKLLPRDESYNHNFDHFYNDLIINEICKKIGIECCDIYLAKYKKRYGTLVENYKTIGNAKYINGAAILREYFDYLERNHLISEGLDEPLDYPLNENYKEFIIKKMNNLETIWDALNYHYRNFPDSKRNKIVEKIMDELTTRYSLDYLVLQADRNAKNWEIIETKDDAYLTPLFDNELSFWFDLYIPELKVDINDKLKFSGELEKYLSFSSEYFKEKFIKLYNILTPDFLENIIKQLEMENDFTFPVLYKKELLENYIKYYNDIANTFGKIENKR